MSALVANMHTSRASALENLATHTAAFDKTTPAGSLACQKDSFLRSRTGTLLASSMYKEEAPKSKGKKKKKGADTANAGDNDTKVLMVCDDSVFFPARGGQPCDKGMVTIDGSVSLNIIDVENVNGKCVLTASTADNGFDPSVLKVESKVEMEIDWMKRFDHMTQHSGQHLISAVAMEDEFKYDTMSWSLQEGLTSYIDFAVDPEKPLEEHIVKFREIESACNNKIRQNLPMTPMWMFPDDPEFQKKVRSRLLPKGLTGLLRLVEIEGVDCNTCCGTHVPSLAYLQMVKFFKFSKIKADTLRVSYAVGERLTNILSESFDRQSKITSILTVPEGGHVETVNKLIEEKKNSEREIKLLNQKLVEVQVNSIVEQGKVDKVVFVDLGISDKNFMSLLAAAVADKGGDSMLVCLIEGEGDSGSFFIVGGEKYMSVGDCGKKAAEFLGGKGGGKGSKFQGKGGKIRSGKDECVKFLLEHVNSINNN